MGAELRPTAAGTVSILKTRWDCCFNSKVILLPKLAASVILVFMSPQRRLRAAACMCAMWDSVDNAWTRARLSPRRQDQSLRVQN